MSTAALLAVEPGISRTALLAVAGSGISAAALLAAAAAAAGVLGAWDVLATAEAARIGERLARALAPLGRARREGRAPSEPERRRLAALAAGSLLAAGWLLGGPLLGVAAALAGPAAVVAVVRARRARYRDELRRGAAPSARALADAIGAGHSIRGALAEVAPAVPGAAGYELRLAARALAVGEPTDAVLERLCGRAGGRAWDTLVAGILLQREAGGDLAALLRELAVALEAQDRLERDARTATAQARLTARLVVGLPVVAVMLAEMAAPGFVRALFAAPLPAALTALAVILQATGLVAIRGIVRPPRA
jgi:tight adherence protein B